MNNIAATFHNNYNLARIPGCFLFDKVIMPIIRIETNFTKSIKWTLAHIIFTHKVFSQKAYTVTVDKKLERNIQRIATVSHLVSCSAVKVS